MDYCMPRADNFLPFKLETNTTLCTHNPLGAKGCGEAGTIGAPAAIMNAVVDALASGCGASSLAAANSSLFSSRNFARFSF
jgi:hypothetical protein